MNLEEFNRRIDEASEELETDINPCYHYTSYYKGVCDVLKDNFLPHNVLTTELTDIDDPIYVNKVVLEFVRIFHPSKSLDSSYFKYWLGRNVEENIELRVNVLELFRYHCISNKLYTEWKISNKLYTEWK